MRDAVKVDQARELRRRMTDAERRLWWVLRNSGLGVKFPRQVPIGSFIVDFVALEQRLIIEVDGGQHAESAPDRKRDLDLRRLGFRVARFWNTEVLCNLDGVVTATREALFGPSP